MISIYSLIAIDDEKIAIDGLLSLLDWGEINISPIYTAYSIAQAKEIFEMNDIDIMICDIEMQQGTGFQLLEWVKERYPDIETIFLTCHADFAYAKQAIQLGCFDYIVKPPTTKGLSSVLEKIILHIENKKKLNEYVRYGKFWSNHQPLLVEKFFLDIINHKVLPQPEAIKKEASEKNIPFNDKIKLLPILVAVKRWKNEPGHTEEKRLNYEMENIIADNLLDKEIEGQVINFDSGRFLCVLYIDSVSDYVEDIIKNKFTKIIAACNEKCSCDLSCYIGYPDYIYKLAETFDKLEEKEKNNVSFENRTFSFNFKFKKTTTVEMPNMSDFSAMISKGSKDEALLYIEDFFGGLVEANKVDADFLKQFHHNFMQIIDFILKQKNIQTHMLFKDSFSEKLHSNADNSVTDMMIWIKYMINKTMDIAESIEKTETMVEKIKNYIDSNIDKKLNREDVADYVFISPNYLTQLFKKETGQTIMEYLFNERLKIAKQKLSDTSLPISTIAVQVGYTNFSHFTKMFRKHVGIPPKEYRKKTTESK